LICSKKGRFLGNNRQIGLGKINNDAYPRPLRYSDKGEYILNGTDVSKLDEDEQAFQRIKK